MEIKTENSWGKHHVDLTPDLAVSWYQGLTIYLGWLGFSITFLFKKPTH